MTKEEKLSVNIQCVRSVLSYMNKLNLGYNDMRKIIMHAAYCIVRFCVREGTPGCKKNSRKTSRLTRETFISYLDWTENVKPELAGEWEFKDDDNAG